MKAIITPLTSTLTACSTEYHVSTAGLNSNPGSQSKPFKMIIAPAKIVQPGDTITVHESICTRFGEFKKSGENPLVWETQELTSGA